MEEDRQHKDPPKRPLPRRLLRIALGVVAFLFVLALAAAVAVPMIDWNRAKGWVSARGSAALGRELAIDGDLSVGWRWDTSRRVHPWLPRLHVSADGVHVANWADGREPVFARCKSIEFDLVPWALLAHEIRVGAVHALQPEVYLERRADNRNNWTFNADPDAGDSGWRFHLGRVRFDAGHVAFHDAARKLELDGEIAALPKPESFAAGVESQDLRAFRKSEKRVGKHATDQVSDGGNDPRTPTQQTFDFAWKMSGTSSGRPIEGSGKIGGLLALQDDEEPWPVQGELKTGETHIALVGTVRNPSEVSALDLRLWLAGASMADLYPLLHVTLPQTKAFSTDGHLTGEIHPHGNRFSYENFHGRVGESDLAGTLTYDGRQERSLLSGNVRSDLLQLADLGPLVGAGAGRGNAADDAAPAQSGDNDTSADKPANKESDRDKARADRDAAGAAKHRVLPTAPLHTERWNAMDASVDFSAKRLLHGDALPISDIRTHIALDNAVLTLAPLHFAIAAGDVDGDIKLDGRASPPRGALHAVAHGMKLKELFPGIGLMQASIGEINGDVGFSTHGKSVAELLGHADGEIKAVVDSGSVSKAALEKAGLNLANFALTRLTGDQAVEINCAAADFALDDGAMKSKLVVIDTEDATIKVDGTISLRNETIDLTAHPDAKGVRLLSLRSPLKITGTFESTGIDVDKKALLTRGGGAIVLAAIAPVAALLPLTATKRDTEKAGKGCAAVFEQLRSEDAGKGKAGRR